MACPDHLYRHTIQGAQARKQVEARALAEIGSLVFHFVSHRRHFTNIVAQPPRAPAPRISAGLLSLLSTLSHLSLQAIPFPPPAPPFHTPSIPFFPLLLPWVSPIIPAINFSVPLHKRGFCSRRSEGFDCQRARRLLPHRNLLLRCFLMDDV